MNRTSKKPKLKLIPQIQLAWTKDFFSKRHILKAQLCGPRTCFCVHGMKQPGSCFVGSASLNFIFNNCSTFLVRYDAQVRSNFVINAFRVGLQTRF